MSAAALPRLGPTITRIGDFELESGDVLPDVSIAHRSWGRLSPTASKDPSVEPLSTTSRSTLP